MEPVDVQAEVGGVPDEVGRLRARPGARSSRSCISQNAPCAAAASAASAASWACGCTSVSGRCRQTYRRSVSASSSRTTGSACPQYGHSKSPNSMTVTDASQRPADVVAFGVDLGDRGPGSASVVAQQRPGPPRRGQQPVSRKTIQVSSDGEHGRGQHAELRLGQFGTGECAVGDQQRHREADAGDGAAAQDAPPSRPAAGSVRGSAASPPRRRDHDARPACRPRSRATMPRVIGEVYAERRKLGVELDAGVGQREERHDQIARPRVEERLQPFVGRQRRGACPRSRGRGELGGRLLAERPDQLASPLPARSRAGEYAGADSPMARPATTGSTPLASNAAHIASPSSDVDAPSLHPSSRCQQQCGERRDGRRRAARARGRRCRPAR